MPSRPRRGGPVPLTDLRYLLGPVRSGLGLSSALGVSQGKEGARASRVDPGRVQIARSPHCRPGRCGVAGSQSGPLCANSLWGSAPDSRAPRIQKRCSCCGCELRTWKIDPGRYRASHWFPTSGGTPRPRLGAPERGFRWGRGPRGGRRVHAGPSSYAQLPHGSAHEGAGTQGATRKICPLPWRFYWLEGRGKLLPATN